MNVWQFLKRRMRSYGSRVAFVKGNITYSMLIRRIEQEKYEGRGRMIAAKGATKQEQAMEILRILAGGNISVPVEHSYGREREEKICAAISSLRPLKNTAAVLFTSGTTGEPKGVMLSHCGIIQNLKAIEGYFRVFQGQKILIARPLVHVAVFTGELLFALFAGLRVDFYEAQFQPQRLADYIDREKVDVFCCTPTLLYHLSRSLRGANLHTVAVSGERLNESVAGVLREKYPKIRFYNVYGLTENSPRVSALTPEDFFRYAGSVGKPVRRTKIKLENGELLVKSPSLMQGYLGDKEKTDEKLAGGYLHTGDMARLDEKGYLYILGRKDDMIIRSGQNVYPAEIENVALQIAGVKNCMAYGEDDIVYGQKICLRVVTDMDVFWLRKELASRLPPYLVPDKILKIDALELTPSGKVKRK